MWEAAAIVRHHIREMFVRESNVRYWLRWRKGNSDENKDYQLFYKLTEI